MKCLRILLLTVVFSAPAVSEAKLPLTAEPAAILYFQMAEEPLPLRSMILATSPSGFDNEFDRQAFLDEQLLPYKVIVHAVEQAARFSSRVRARVGEYDFANNAFPLEGIHETTYLTFNGPPGVYGPGLAVQIVNSAEFRQLKMAPDAARALLERLDGDKRLMVRFTVRPVSSEQRDFSGGRTLSVHRALNVYAESATILVRDSETELATMQATSTFEDHAPEKRNLTAIEERLLIDPWAQAWGSRAQLEALIEHYNLENWGSFERMEVAQPCISDFGYSKCQNLIERRRQLALRCTNTLENDGLCWRIQGLPYTRAEADR